MLEVVLAWQHQARNVDGVTLLQAGAGMAGQFAPDPLACWLGWDRLAPSLGPCG